MDETLPPPPDGFVREHWTEYVDYFEPVRLAAAVAELPAIFNPQAIALAGQGKNLFQIQGLHKSGYLKVACYLDPVEGHPSLADFPELSDASRSLTALFRNLRELLDNPRSDEPPVLDLSVVSARTEVGNLAALREMTYLVLSGEGKLSLTDDKAKRSKIKEVCQLRPGTAVRLDAGIRFKLTNLGSANADGSGGELFLLAA